MLKLNVLLNDIVSLLHVLPMVMCIRQKRFIGFICYLSFILTNLIRYKYTRLYNYRYVVLFKNIYYNWLDFIGNECRLFFNMYLFYKGINYLIISAQNNSLLDLLFTKRLYLMLISLISCFYMIPIIKKKNYIPIGSDRHQKYEFIQNCVDFVGSVSLLYGSY